MKVSRYFAALLAILALLYLGVFLTGNKKPHPKLGLDLQGGAQLLLSAVTPDGKTPSSESMNLARQIIANRVNASGVAEPEVVTDSRGHLIVSVAGGHDPEELKKLVAPAKLSFRKVLSTTQDHPVTTPLPPDSCGATLPGAISSASPSASGSASASASGSASASASASASKSASASPSASASASASGSASPSASVNPSTAALAAKKAKDLESAKTKVGAAAWAAAASTQDPSQADLAALAPFSKLNCAEVAALPAQVQFLVPTISCAQLNGRDPGSLEDPTNPVVACDQGENVHAKYALDLSKVEGTDVASASSGFDTNNGGWHVTLKFTGKGQGKWTALTQEAMQAAQQQQQQQQGGAQVAIVLDNQVVSAPQIQSVIVGDAIINGGGIDQNTSQVLATQLKYGALPLNFRIENFQTVSPTLGLQQMNYGLLAGGIGLILVVLYCLLYYRALGLVVIASLGVSGAVVFACLVLLGRSLGFTLSLAGIAGFIVAIGITADSFVVFFERLKDEVKEGRTVRSAVPRAWVRARRTILSADAVSFIAAAVLYLLAAGPVKGFAFTLGLSTIIDLLVVFLFTHPLVAVLARSSGFTSPRFSGLGNARSDKALEAAAASGRSARFGAVRTKES
ncbi:MAG: protein-export membrane protein SecD [Actinobacteria bacterium 13_2_20CM_2_71_6]|nr:MAG: protein-export membrane protein SecD [Actinobacteria bacterium 13_2_20CM_2_71_6]